MSESLHFTSAMGNEADRVLQSFPRFDADLRLEGVLKEGDMLYLPPMWFHEVALFR